MKLRRLPTILLLLSIACHSPVKHNIDSKKPTATKAALPVTGTEYMNWDSVKLNGTIPMISSFKSVTNKLGKPDSIKPGDETNGSFYPGKFKFCYYKNVLFEKYNDTLVFRSIEFKKSSDFYLINDKYKFYKTSTANDFKRLFPSSYENNELSGTSMDKYQWISLAAFTKQSDNEWYFLFDRNSGKILSIEHYVAQKEK